MILAFLDVINNPQEFAATWRNGEFHVASIEEVQARGIKVRGLPRVEVHETDDQVDERKAEHEER